MTAVLKITNKTLSLILLLLLLLNLAAIDLMPVLRVQAMPAVVESVPCSLFPIGLSAQSLVTSKIGEQVEINSAELHSGAFGWLSWTGSPSANQLAVSLTPPGDSTTYTNPDNPNDHQVSPGDWVRGIPGVSNSKGVTEALEKLKTATMVIPVWDKIRGEGNNTAYHVISFARIQLVDYQLPKDNRITVKYLGTACANADVKVSESVTSAAVSHQILTTFEVSHEKAIPGDHITYTTTLTDVAENLELKGKFSITNTSDVSATVAYFYDLIRSQESVSDTWKNLAGYAATQSDYTPHVPVPLQTGLTLTAVPVPVNGVNYPTAGNGITGTVLAAGATAIWNYTASAVLSAEQIQQLMDPAVVKSLQNSVHFEVTPVAPENVSGYNANADFIQLLRAQNNAIEDGSVRLTLPDGESVVLDFPSVPAGTTRSVQTGFVVPTLPARLQDESEAAYLVRLQEANNSLLKATLNVAGKDPQFTGTSLLVPIVTIDKTGPEVLKSGSQGVYDLMLTNVGSTSASGFSIVDQVSNGSRGSLNQLPGELHAGETTVVQAIQTLPNPQSLEERLPPFLTDVASLHWQDANGNDYGSFSDFFTSTVESAMAGYTIELSPEKAGPKLTGTEHTLRATVLDQQRNPVSDVKVFFSIDGANNNAQTHLTGPDGTASITYTGTSYGWDTVTARIATGFDPLVSNSALVHWISPIKPVTTSIVEGKFFAGVGANAVFNIKPGTSPAFTQVFPVINFNPPTQTTLSSVKYVGPLTKPPADVTTDLYGYSGGIILAHGNGYEAAVGSLSSFSAVFTGQLTVTTAGEHTFIFYSDDGFMFGVGNGAIRTACADCAYYNVPASGVTAFNGFPVMGAYNYASGNTARKVIINFPAAGIYPYEIDYTEIGGSWHRSLTMLNADGKVVTPSTSLVISPHSQQYPIDTKIGVPQSFTVTALDASGLPLANLPVTLTIWGVNNQEMKAVTDSTGVAVFTYASAVGGVDVVQATAAVDGSIIGITAEVKVSW